MYKAMREIEREFYSTSTRPGCRHMAADAANESLRDQHGGLSARQVHIQAGGPILSMVQK